MGAAASGARRARLRSVRSAVPTKIRSLVISAVLIGGTVVAERASACGPPACIQRPMAPASGTVIPASAPAFAFPRPLVWGQPVPVVDGGIRLLGPDGGEVPLELQDDVPAGGIFAVPLQPLAPDAGYRLLYTEHCTGEYGGPQEDAGEAAFFTSGARGLPAAAGSLTADNPSEVSIGIWTRCGSCERVVPVVIAALHFEPDETLGPWLPLTRFRTIIDGAFWADTPYGALRDGGQFYLGDQWFPGARRVDQLYARCHRHTDSTEDDGLTIGPHAVQIEAIIAGVGTAYVSNTITVELDCPIAGTGVEPGDQCAWNRPGVDAGTPGDEVLTCGCGAGVSGALPWVFIVVALTACQRRPGRAAAREGC